MSSVGFHLISIHRVNKKISKKNPRYALTHSCHDA
jgi:hypothetical protein